MADLALLTVARRDLNDMVARQRRGDPEAKEFFANMWPGGAPIVCFLCDREVEHPHPLILPDPASRDGGEMLAAQLCDACHALPIQVRLSRSFKIFKRMHRAATGRNISFHFVGNR
jgi:hypothetical protein